MPPLQLLLIGMPVSSALCVALTLADQYVTFLGFKRDIGSTFDPAFGKKVVNGVLLALMLGLLVLPMIPYALILAYDIWEYRSTPPHQPTFKEPQL